MAIILKTPKNAQSLKKVYPALFMCLFFIGVYYMAAAPNFQTLIRNGSRKSVNLEGANSIAVTDEQTAKHHLTLAEFTAANDRLVLETKVVDDCECGCRKSTVANCPRQYSLEDVEKSANAVITKEIGDYMDFALQERRHASQISCLARDFSGTDHHTDSGGYCLGAFLQVSQDSGRNPEQVILPFPDRPISIPRGHIAAPKSMLECLYSFIEKERITSFSDFGAGLGQYGMDLERKYPTSLLYRGFDGAGDVEVYTQGFLRFFDLTIPLNLPVSDWVMSLEVGEHVPSHLEGMMIRNLHAHNCRGIVLSWGVPGQNGLNHINLHDNEYLIDIFTQLGYVHDAKESNRFRDMSLTDSPWFAKSFMVLRRQNPVC